MIEINWQRIHNGYHYSFFQISKTFQINYLNSTFDMQREIPD